jgi:hypothetical protein
MILHQRRAHEDREMWWGLGSVLFVTWAMFFFGNLLIMVDQESDWSRDREASFRMYYAAQRYSYQVADSTGAVRWVRSATPKDTPVDVELAHLRKAHSDLSYAALFTARDLQTAPRLIQFTMAFGWWTVCIALLFATSVGVRLLTKPKSLRFKSEVQQSDN